MWRVVVERRPFLDAVADLRESADYDGLVARVVCRQDTVPDVRNHVCNLPDRGNLRDARTDVYHQYIHMYITHRFQPEAGV